MCHKRSCHGYRTFGMRKINLLHLNNVNALVRLFWLIHFRDTGVHFEWIINIWSHCICLSKELTSSYAIKEIINIIKKIHWHWNCKRKTNYFYNNLFKRLFSSKKNCKKIKNKQILGKKWILFWRQIIVLD